MTSYPGGGADTQTIGGRLERPLLHRLLVAGFWLLFALIAFWTLAPVQFRPAAGHPVIERFCAFLALGAALGASYPRRIWLVLAAISAIAVGLEVLQTLTPTRDGRPIDAIEKLAGGLVGAVLAVVAFHFSSPRAVQRSLQTKSDRA